MIEMKWFLELLTKAFPPPGKLSHSLRLTDGKTIRLSLWLGAGYCEHLTLNESDLAKGADRLVEAIVLTRGRPSP